MTKHSTTHISIFTNIIIAEYKLRTPLLILQHNTIT